MDPHIGDFLTEHNKLMRGETTYISLYSKPLERARFFGKLFRDFPGLDEGEKSNEGFAM